MEEKKNIFDYLGQVFCTFGISMLIMALFCKLVGEEAGEISTMFALGREGVPVTTMLQFFIVNVLIAGFRFLFFSEGIIRHMSLFKRTLCMLCCVLVTIGVCVYVCGWFPFRVWRAWLAFFISFGICFIISLLIMHLKEKLENRRMEEGLKRAKEKMEDTSFSVES